MWFTTPSSMQKTKAFDANTMIFMLAGIRQKLEAWTSKGDV
jgi:hypothetical protein